jgi:hypothetical protein
MAGHPSTHEQPDIDARRAEAARLSLMGWSPLAIGRHLYADPAHNSRGLQIPQGYGIARYKDGRPPLPDQRLGEAVNKDIERALKDSRTALEDNIEALRRQRVHQYELLLKEAFKDAGLDRDNDVDDLYEDDPQALAARVDRQARARDQIIRILSRLDTVQGISRPVRQEITGAGGTPLLEPVSLSELERLIAAAGSAGKEDPAGGDEG